jgi:Transposase IS116/IS110/IS902 family
VRRRAEFYYQQLDALRVLRQGVRRELLVESKKQKAWKRLCQIPAIGPIRAAVLLGILQTPHRFRAKRPLWKYSGLAIETCTSADYRSVNGQLTAIQEKFSSRTQSKLQSRSEECVQGGGGHRLQQTRSVPGVLRGFVGQRHEARNGPTDLGTKDCHDRTDRLEEGSVLRRPTSETTNSLGVSDRVRSILGIFSGGAVGFSRHSGSRASLSRLVRRCVPRAPSLTRDATLGPLG